MIKQITIKLPKNQQGKKHTFVKSFEELGYYHSINVVIVTKIGRKCVLTYDMENGTIDRSNRLFKIISQHVERRKK